MKNTISIIRGRGQLTIPDSIRKQVKWADSMSAVSIALVKSNEIVIKPHESYVDWDDVWQGVRKARAISGGSKAVSATSFLRADRKSH